MDMKIIYTCFSLISIAGLLYLIFWRYKAYRIDAFRQDIFEIRDELFEYAKNHKISFNHPAYGTLRSLMNGFIRFGHQVTFPRLFLLGILLRNSTLKNYESFSERWLKTTKDLKKDEKRDLNILLQKVHYSIFRHLILTSPECIVTILPPLVLLALSKYYIDKLNKLLFKSNENIDGIAYVYGSF